MAMIRKQRRLNSQPTWWRYIVAALLILIYILPLYIMLLRSFKTVQDFAHNLALPKVWNFENYKKALSTGDIWIGFKNSIILCIGTVALEIVVSTLAAYGIARSSSAIANSIRKANMLIMMIPSIALLVGTYSLMVKLKLSNSLLGLTLLSAAAGMPATIFMYVNFIVSIPVALDEAAAIDGAGVIRTFIKIILPQLKPVTVTRVIMVAVASWNNYLMPMFLLQDKSKFTIILVIKAAFARGNGAGDMPLACATCALGLLPVIAMYLFLQKFIIEGQIDSSVK